MSYKIVNHLNKIQVTLSIVEVMKIPQQKENLIKYLESETPKGNQREDVVISYK